MKERIENLYINPQTNEFYKDSDRRLMDDPEGLRFVGSISRKTGARAFFFRQPEQILWLDKAAEVIYISQQERAKDSE